MQQIHLYGPLPTPLGAIRLAIYDHADGHIPGTFQLPPIRNSLTERRKRFTLAGVRIPYATNSSTMIYVRFSPALPPQLTNPSILKVIEAEAK